LAECEGATLRGATDGAALCRTAGAEKDRDTDGALHLVAKLRGDETARRVAAYMEYDKWVPSAGLIVTK